MKQESAADLRYTVAGMKIKEELYMNKKILATLVAGLALVSAVGCAKTPGGTETGATSTYPTGPNYSVEPATLPQGPSGDSTAAPVEETLEANPTFSDISMTLYVYVANGNIRSKTETVLTEGAICGYVKEGDTLAATGESKEWYRVLYNEKTCYVRKSIVCDNALIDAFQDVRDEVTISQNVNVRSMPKAIKSSANDLSIRGTLLKGTKVTRTGIGDGWSRVLFSYTYTKDGAKVTEDREYYISNECIAEAGTATATEASKS